MRARIYSMVVLAGIVGCHAPPAVPTDLAVTAAIAVDPAAYHLDGTLSDLADGDPIDLLFPPQGGHVLFVGAKVRNLGEGTVRLRGRLLDPDGDGGAPLLRGEDVRTVEMVRTLADASVWTPPLESYVGVSNIPVCPAYSAEDLYGRRFILELEVTELSTGRSGTGRRMVVPSCRQSDAPMKARCECECARDYRIGKCP